MGLRPLGLAALLIHTAAFAGGSVGVDYLSSEAYISGIRGIDANVQSSGPGFSLNWNVTDNWTLSASHSGTDSSGSKAAGNSNLIRVTAAADSSSNSVGLAYYGDKYWAGLRYQQSESQHQLQGISRLNSALGLDVDEAQDSGTLSLEMGRDWLLGNWSPALSISLSRQSVEIQRVERLDTLSLTTFQSLNEDLSGVDLGLSASIAFYYQMSDSVLLAPNIGIFRQTSLSGDVAGVSAFGQRARTGGVRQSLDYREKLQTPEQTSVNFGLNLLAGDWLWSVGTLTNPSSGSDAAFWFAGLNYSF